MHYDQLNQMFFASSLPPSAQDVLQPCGRLGRFGNNPPARLQRVEEGLASGQRATLHFALQRQRLPAVGGCDETEFVAFTDELSCERVERQLAVRAARNCAKVGSRSARQQYAQCRGGNVVRCLRRSEPGVSGVRRRAGRARLRRADGHPRRAVLGHARSSRPSSISSPRSVAS